MIWLHIYPNWEHIFKLGTHFPTGNTYSNWEAQAIPSFKYVNMLPGRDESHCPLAPFGGKVSEKDSKGTPVINDNTGSSTMLDDRPNVKSSFPETK